MEAAPAVLVMKSSISLNDVNVSFQFRDQAIDNLRSKIVSLLNPRLVADQKHYVHALKDITLQINEGERVGLIGVNGSGKSTLLKVLAGVLYPTSGSLEINGQVNSIFDPSLGFDLEASGIENVIIRCMLMGVSSEKLDKIREEISNFSELGDALNRPLKTYSTGMAMRLAFSIATAVEPEILIMDEWLSAGDAKFVSKAFQRMEELVMNSRILVLASHSEQIISDLCTRLIWFDSGVICDDGSPSNVLANYKKYLER
jgi:lipopolysaccharide transport system ATP-binding protein